MTNDTPSRLRVLFLCTHNSARSQMAEALVRHKAGDQRIDVASAGSEPGGAVNEFALRLIQELGANPADYRPKGFDAVLGRDWDLVITVCDDAQDACPVLPIRTVTVHWGIPDPTKAQGTAVERMAAFRSAYGMLARRIDLLLALGPERMERSALRDRLSKIHEDAKRADQDPSLHLT